MTMRCTNRRILYFTSLEVAPTTLVTFYFCDRERWPMILTSELHLDGMKFNQQAKYLRQRSFTSNVIVRIHRHTHTAAIVRPGPLK